MPKRQINTPAGASCATFNVAILARSETIAVCQTDAGDQDPSRRIVSSTASSTRRWRRRVATRLNTARIRYERIDMLSSQRARFFRTLRKKAELRMRRGLPQSSTRRTLSKARIGVYATSGVLPISGQPPYIHYHHASVLNESRMAPSSAPRPDYRSRRVAMRGGLLACS